MAHDSTENVPIDAEAGRTGFKPYGEYQHANSAYDLARLLMIVKQLLHAEPPQVSQAIATLDEAADVLFPMSEFHRGAYELYRIAIEGRATTAHEDLMKTLGITF
jgi:hypothetical protein